MEVELGTELTALEQDSEGVSATLRKTCAGEEAMEKIRAAYVIGADGGKGQCGAAPLQDTVLIDAPGRTRKLIGATLEGQTKDSDGQAFADINVEHLSTEVRQSVTMRTTAG